MKVLAYIIFLLLPLTAINAQRIGELAPEKPPEIFPDNIWGADIMFGEGGFGLGTFLRKNFSQEITGFVDISISESKDEREVEYIDYWGNKFTIGKVNRVFLIPLNFGIQYRLFTESLTDNLRPYINAGVGPTLAVSTPYDQEFFSAFGDAKAHYAAGGYIGLGANFGLSKSNLVGLNVRYYYVHIFGEGVENLEGRLRKSFGHFYLTLNLGIMY
ncbi:MAG: hypothetical protein AB1521_02660 [Bacteroidota bacterium]